MSEKPWFFAQLTRRNVYKVAVTCAVVSWLLIQIATQAFPFFDIPNWPCALSCCYLSWAYVVVAWLLIQISTQLFPFPKIPNWLCD